ncbi:complement component C8 gamma chain [Lissotriton helveticus]
MRPSTGALLLLLLQISGSCGQKRGAKNPKKPENPIEKVQAKDNFSPAQFAGKWFLIGVASKCEYLKENNFRVEATTIVVTPDPKDAKSLPISTFRKLDGICWDIRHKYQQTGAPGRYSLKVRGYKSNVDVVVGETDYSTYAVLYFQKQRTITVKLYARSATVASLIIEKYEQRAKEQGIEEDFIYYFPKYGFCESADQFHILTA